MASKGQKFKKYSPKLIDEIHKKYFENHVGYKTLAKQYRIPRGTVWNWIVKTKPSTTNDHSKRCFLISFYL